MRLRRLVAMTLSFVCVVGVPPPLGAANGRRGRNPSAQQTAASTLTFSGTVRRDGQRIADVRVRLRNVDKGTIVDETVSDAQGQFSFALPEPGLYVVEAVNDDGGVIAVSNQFPFTTSSMTGDVILPSLRAAAFWTSTTFLVLSTAAGAGVIGWVVGGDEDAVVPASPER